MPPGKGPVAHDPETARRVALRWIARTKPGLLDAKAVDVVLAAGVDEKEIVLGGSRLPPHNGTEACELNVTAM